MNKGANEIKGRYLFTLSDKCVSDLEYLSKELAIGEDKPNKSATVEESIRNRAIKVRCIKKQGGAVE